MKLCKDDLKTIKPILEKSNLLLKNTYIGFPIETKIKSVDEFGIETVSYKAESYFGNTYIPLIVDNENSATIGYAATTNLVSFNLAEYFELVDRPELTDDEKTKLCQFECCIVHSDKIILTK